MKMDLSVSSQVLKQGEVLTMNCSVRDVDMAFFTWTFPRRQVAMATVLSQSSRMTLADYPTSFLLSESGVQW